MVDRITRDVRGMGAFAAKRSLPPAEAAAVKPEAIQLEEHVFAPHSYEAIAREALGEAATSIPHDSGDPREDARLLSALLDLQASVLVREDGTLSRRLEAEPRDPGAHERAALLLGAFALRERAERSTDTRPALTRMTAHLAFARALRSGADPDLAGRYAETLLLTLVGRERDALARVDALATSPRAGPAEKAWLRALRLRNTGDWRIARNEKRLTLLERLEEFRALVDGQDDLPALAWLDQGRPEPIPDWGLIALSGRGYSVETGNRFADLSLMMELAQAAEVLTSLHGAPTDQASFLESLDERPEGLVGRDATGQLRIAVIGWGLWADRFQRSIVFGLARGVGHRKGLGQPGESRAYAEQSRGRFGRIELYPLVLRAHANDAQAYRTAMAAVRELALRSPERLTGGHWQLIRMKEEFAPVPSDLPNETTWFEPALPRGTLVDVDWRIEALRGLKAIGADELKALREVAPHNVPLARLAASRQAVTQRSAAELALVYGPLAEFHVGIMGSLAQAAWYDPADYRARQGALCEIMPQSCLLFGFRLAEMGFPDEAAAAYQKGFDGAADRVGAANESRWLVDYYFDRGKLEKAEAVAREAAAVYSASGLFTMARLMERMGRLREAEEYYRRILDRYRDADELAGFYYRQARIEKKAAYEPKLKDALALALPSGLEPLARATLTAPPTDGAVIKGANDNTKRHGIQFGHVIVGLDGFRVRDADAYFTVKALSQSPKMKLVIWRGQSYDDVDVELWDRRFRVDIQTLGAKK